MPALFAACCDGHGRSDRDDSALVKVKETEVEEKERTLSHRRSPKDASPVAGTRSRRRRPTVAKELEDPSIVATVELAEQRLGGGMSEWQRSWCTARNVNRFLLGRRGDRKAAAEILAQALKWREEYREVLSGQREPRWQTDLRVLTQSDAGNSITYGCFRHMVRVTAENTRDIIEHMAAVMEAATTVTARGGAEVGDVVLDCHGFRMLDNLNPAPALALMRMANQPYRDCLRTAFVIDAPLAFSSLWGVAAPLLSEKTRQKVKFMTMDEAVHHLRLSSGARAAADVERAMRLNRTSEGCTGHKLPSEVPLVDEDGIDRPSLVRPLSRRLSKKLSRRLTKTLAAGASAASQGARRFECCRRRR